LQKFRGTYEIQKGVEVLISLINEQLFSQLTEQKEFPLFAESEFAFFLKVVGAQIEFRENENGAITNLFLLQK